MLYPKEFKQNIESKGIRLVEPRRTLFIGGLILIILLLFPILIIAFTNWELWTKLIILLGIGIILFFGFYWNNLVHIDEVHVGVPKLFGKRQSSWLLEEGYHWLPPKPIMGVHKVYIGQQNLNVGHQVIPKKEIVQVNVDASVYWQVVDPFKITTAQRILNELDATGFIKAIQGNLRLFAAQNEYDTKSLMTVGEEYGSGVSNKLNAFVKSSREDWGIDILDVSLTKLVTINPDTMYRFERILNESLEKQYEILDAETLASKIQILMEKAKIPGDVAADFVLGLRGILQRKESKFMGDVPSLSTALEYLYRLFKDK